MVQVHILFSDRGAYLTLFSLRRMSKYGIKMREFVVYCYINVHCYALFRGNKKSRPAFTSKTGKRQNL